MGMVNNAGDLVSQPKPAAIPEVNKSAAPVLPEADESQQGEEHQVANQAIQMHATVQPDMKRVEGDQ